MKSQLIIAVLLIITALSAESPAEKELRKSWPGNMSAHIPLLKKEEIPKIDGTIDENEWRKAVKFAGFIQEPGSKGLVKGKHGFVYLAVDSDYLYVAALTSTPNMDPGGGLVALAQKHDSQVYNDDSIEVLINPDTNQDKCYQLVLNSKGVIFDQIIHYATDNRDVGYSAKDMLVGTNVGSGWWHLEMKIPRVEIGNPENHIKINVARNWTGSGASAISPTSSHHNRERMLTLCFDKEVPVLKMDELGAPGEGDWEVNCRVENVKKERPVTLAIRLLRHCYPSEKSAYTVVEKMVEETFNSAGAIKFKYKADNDEIRSLNVVLMDAKSNQVLSRRIFNARKGLTEDRIPVSGEFELDEAGAGLYWQYPGYNKIVAEISFKSAFQVKKLTVTTHMPDGGTVHTDGKFSMRKWRTVLPGGPEKGVYRYDVTVTLEDGKKIDFQKAFQTEKRVFEWENNTLGKEKVIIPPFTPITANANTFSTIFRHHKVNAEGLWDSVMSKEHELLAEPMCYEAVIDGKKVDLSGKPNNFIISAGGHDATVHNNIAMGNFVIKSDSVVEYDGFFWNKVRFHNPDKLKLDKLTLRIPMKESEAKLFHAVPDSIRSNPAGSIPAGNGIVWNGSQLKRMVVFGKQLIHPQFVPYLWLGTEERGISYMMNSSFGTRLDEEIPSLRLIREKDQVIVEIDFINIPTVVDENDVLEFGLMATPVKPINPELRRVITDYRGEGIKGFTNAFCVLGSLMGFPSWFKQPVNNDYELIHALCEFLFTGKGREKYEQVEARFIHDYDPKLEKIFSPYPGPDNDGRTYFQWYKGVYQNYRNITIPNAASGTILYRYSDPRLIAHLEDIPGYFRSEWSTNPVGYTYAYRSYPVQTNIDYMIWCYNLEMKNGLQGVYLDDMFIIPNDNIDTDARIDRFGMVHSDCGLLRLRELVKRLATLQHCYNFKPRYLQIHMTNALLVPCFSFGSSQLSWEDKYGESEFQDRFTSDSIRATDLGLKIGAMSVALDGIYRYTMPYEEWCSGKFRHLTRTQLAMTLPHDVKIKRRLTTPNNGVDWEEVSKVYTILNRFGYWQNDVKFVPYFQEDGGIGEVPVSVLASSYRRPGKTVIVLGNTGDALDFTLLIDMDKLNVPADSKLYDAETGLELVGNAIKLPRRDYKMILVGPPEVLDAAHKPKLIERITGTPIAIDTKFEFNAEGKLKLWLQNTGNDFQPLGKVETATPGAVRLVSAEKSTVIFAKEQIHVTPGRTYRIGANISGSGAAGVGIYCYGPKWRWEGALLGTSQVLGTPGSIIETEFTIPPGVEEICVALYASPNTAAIFQTPTCEQL